MTGGKLLCFLVPFKHCWMHLFLQLAGNIIYQEFVETKGQLRVGGVLREMRPVKLAARSF